VLKLLRHLLCLGILLGLVGNGVAVAAPCILMTQSQPAAMADMPDCDMAQPTNGHEGDKGKAPGCMAMAACTAVIGIKEPLAAAAILYRTAATYFWPSAAVFAGRDVAPEPEPPTLLG
jgi:hypothetical protein